MFSEEKVKINFIQGSYWLVPSVFTFSKRKWVSRPYKNFENIIESNNWTFTPLHININSDPELEHYNKFQKSRDLNEFVVDKKILETINTVGHYDFKFSPFVSIRLDKTSIKIIRSGKIFCFPDFYFEMITKKQKQKNKPIFLLWRKNGFEIKEQILEEKNS